MGVSRSFLGAIAAALISSQAGAVTVTSGGTIANIDPLVFNGTSAAFYNYNDGGDSSANFPTGFGLDTSSTAVFFLLETTPSAPDTVSVGFVLDAENDGSGGTFDVELTGLDGSPSIAVVDGEGSDTFALSNGGSTFTSTLDWIECCTDGFVLDGVGSTPGSGFTVSIDLDTLAGISAVSLAVPNETGGADVVSFLTGIDQLSGTLDIDVAFTSVPVPAPAALLLSGLGLMWVMRRRRRHA